MDDHEDLLVGPRGRRLCLELALAHAREVATPASEALLHAAFFAAHDLDPGRGTSSALLTTGTGRPPVVPHVTPDEVTDLLDALPLESLDDRLLLEALTAAVDNARYWQEPDGEDVLAASAPVRGALGRVAASIATFGGAAWWSTPLDRTEQWSVAFDDAPSSPPVLHGTVREHLARWRSEVERSETEARHDRPSDPRAPLSGIWWSTPPREVTQTTRSLANLGPLGLHLVEDSFTMDSATVRPVGVPDDAQVFEVDGPEAWAQLCRRYPIDVTASRRHDWFRTTGAVGTWVMPDWARAAENYDAVHLTVTGYLTTAGRAVAVTDDSSSVLAGWDPDQTYWLTDVAPVTDVEQRWGRRDDDTWGEALP
ncbi:hypothetical protein [Actinotalea sp. C106]|uniref:hypothetical protein n=1 Tax=Actinotalea sp. C106 TaxID=2908644 RepID=UPI0020279CDB|nr:hypothetical protein [Actinotalea sp. C106]